MLSTDQKKQAIRQYKERKPSIGIYAIRCSATDRLWVGAVRNLDAAKNSAWFALRIGAHREKTLQDQWTTHGESAFTYEVLESFPDDLSVLAIPDQLKDRKQHWISHLGAQGLL
jgi:hypothetical protein